MRERLSFSMVLTLAGMFVSAGLSTDAIADALRLRYVDGEYVDPEGPLNIMRGHSCVNNGMIAKQRKYAAPVRLEYSSANDARGRACVYTRRARDDDVREFSADSEAMLYLTEHYKMLQLMFTVENDVVAVNKSSWAPFCSLFANEPGKCLELFAVLLLLAGGADIRLDPNSYRCTDDGEWVNSLFAHDAAGSSRVHVLDIETADRATLEAVEFFAKYGGNSAGQVAEFGLHYTDSPSFLMQAYICEFLESSEDVRCIFKAAKGIVAKLPVNSSCGQPQLRFFTKNADYADAYRASCDALSDVEAVFDGSHRGLLRRWQHLNHNYYSGGDDSKQIASTLLKLCYCLCSDPAVNGWDARLLNDSENSQRSRFREFVCAAFSAADTHASTVADPYEDWELVRKPYQDFLTAARAGAHASEAIKRCFGDYIPAGLATDPRYFLVVLAWVLGEPEEELMSLFTLLKDGVYAARGAHGCKKVSERVTRLLKKFSIVPVDARFEVFKEFPNERCGALRLAFAVGCGRALLREYVVRLVFTPEKVEIMLLSEHVRPSDSQRRRLVSALKQVDTLRSLGLPALAQGESDECNDCSLRTLIQESVVRCLNPAAYRARADGYYAKICTAEGPLACHVAISRWMAYQPMQTMSEAVNAADQLLPLLPVQSDDVSDSAQPALAVGSPVVAVLDNIVGSAAVADSALREFCAVILRHCAYNRVDFSQSLFLPTDSSPRNMQDWDASACDSLLICLDGYDIPEMLFLHAERRACFDYEQ
ncbi:hypothetical protein PAPHI01_0462 [Pancytospora philotis]|nr:hypothetical protein PAPHI01_0462 [Pancytospora philotis]